jgi:hypothetical protein
MLIFDVEVDVAVQRPPTPANTRTVFVTVAVDDQPSLFAAEADARLLAAQIASNWGVMPLATRITGAEL